LHPPPSSHIPKCIPKCRGTSCPFLSGVAPPAMLHVSLPLPTPVWQPRTPATPPTCGPEPAAPSHPCPPPCLPRVRCRSGVHGAWWPARMLLSSLNFVESDAFCSPPIFCMISGRRCCAVVRLREACLPCRLFRFLLLPALVSAGPGAPWCAETATSLGYDTRGTLCNSRRTARALCCSKRPSASRPRVLGTAPCPTGAHGLRAGETGGACNSVLHARFVVLLFVCYPKRFSRMSGVGVGWDSRDFLGYIHAERPPLIRWFAFVWLRSNDDGGGGRMYVATCHACFFCLRSRSTPPLSRSQPVLRWWHPAADPGHDHPCFPWGQVRRADAHGALQHRAL
jgi:hypothetical protein